jgi:hypothetical protein
MAGYLDQYGAGEERRNRIIIRSVLAVLAIAIVGTLSWYLLLNHRQESVVKNFVAAIKQGDLPGAYRAWGCPPPNGCSGYDYNQFLKDWGPGPEAPAASAIGLTDSEQCNNGVLLTLQVNATRTEKLWMERGNDTIGFAPYAICPQQIPYEIMAHRTVGKLRKLLLK